MKKIILSLVIVALLFTACEKQEKIVVDAPPAISKLIEEWQKSEKKLASVAEYRCSDCNEEIVYRFSELEKVGHCNYFNTHIFDQEGNLLCSAYPRLQDEDCIRKYGNCEEVKVIWKQMVK